jgi:tetratricopeptide (TPR) repeat protein
MYALKPLRIRRAKRASTRQCSPIADAPCSINQDSRYVRALQEMQRGAWDRVLPLLRAVQMDYPQEPAATQLLQEAHLRAEVDTVWHEKIKARSRRLFSRRLLGLLLYLCVVVVLAVVGFGYYQQSVASRQAASAQQEILARAQQALDDDRAQDAVQLFQQVLAVDPQNQQAADGYQAALRQLDLASRYAAGVAALNAQNHAQAYQILSAIAETMPHYRDVDRLLMQAQSRLGREEQLQRAEAAYRAQQWSAAIEAYEALQASDSSYEASTVTAHLAEAYLRAGQQLIAQSPAAGADPARAATYFQKALALNPADSVAATEMQLVTDYLAGEQARQQGNLQQAVAALESIAATRPTYLNGAPVQQLYDLYLALGESATQQADPLAAIGWYEKAVALPALDHSQASTRLQALLAPPTATPEPIVPVQAPVVPPPPPTPSPTPTPAPAGLADFHGWIAFRSNRSGDTAIYLMQPDGSQQQPAPNDAVAQIEQLYARQQGSADGTAQLYVANAPDRADTNLFMIQVDQSLSATQPAMLTDWPGMEYDPVWSASGAIAFVANHTGNDEIWLLPAPGGEAVQLTHNEWEWDKHPTWSPDGGQLAFYSNRTGIRQIWVMNADGSNQRNISNNTSEDWDPVWIP